MSRWSARCSAATSVSGRRTSRKWRGYMPVLSRIVQGDEPRHPRHPPRPCPKRPCSFATPSKTTRRRVESLQTEVSRRNLRRFLVMDLLWAASIAITRCSIG